jgi:hypothetical protein
MWWYFTCRGVPWSYNPHNDIQGEIIYNIFNYNSNRMYLVDYKYSILKEYDTLCIKVLSINKKKTHYNVLIKTITEDNFTIGSILTCNCNDFKYRSEKCDIVCKHIVFVLCKICGIFTNEYFITKILPGYQTDYVIRLLRSDAVWRNPNVSIKYVNEIFKSDTCEMCCICLEGVTPPDDVNREADDVDSSVFGSECVRCPVCRNSIHKDCMEKWLIESEEPGCVYCRSCWEDYILI